MAWGPILLISVWWWEFERLEQLGSAAQGWICLFAKLPQQSCSKYYPCETSAGQCVPKGSYLEVTLRDLSGKAEKTRPVVDLCLECWIFQRKWGRVVLTMKLSLAKYPFCLHSPVLQSDPYKHTEIPPLFWAAWHLLCLLQSCSCLFSSYCNYGTFRWKISRSCAVSLMLCLWRLSSYWAMEWNGSGAPKKRHF